jgi:RNA polymerase sigma factor (sigma-70 family)
VQQTPDAELVAAASSGDRRALEDLVAGSLTLVYNVVGRALGGHADVDDVVQETMLSVVDGLDGLRDTGRFRSWLIAIAMQKVRERWRRQQTRPRPGFLDEVFNAPDPGADFVDLTITRLELSGQRREVAEATRWIEPAEREVLALWWMEAAGELSRAELVEALELTPQHAAVRVQRVKERLEAARIVVRALRSAGDCPEFRALTAAWDGAPSGLWRKRLVRHTRGCPRCSAHCRDLLPVEGLLAGLALVPLPPGGGFAPLPHGALGHAAGHAAGHTAAGHAAGHAAGLGARAAYVLHSLAAKPVAAVVAGALVLGGSAGAGYVLLRPAPRHRAPAVALPSATPTADGLPSPTGAPSDAMTPALTGFVYGQTVDGPESAPAPNAKPGPLPQRPQTALLAMSGVYGSKHPAGISEMYVLMHRGDHLVISGRGYLLVRWQLQHPGLVHPAAWTGLTGKLFHVASGGGHRMDDDNPGVGNGTTWMGDRVHGYDTLPPGAQQMWQNEYYYLDGSVTLDLAQAGARYSLIVAATTWQAVTADIDRGPADGVIRYGVVRDTGDDAAPVPQYLTRSSPADPLTVPQYPHLS